METSTRPSLSEDTSKPKPDSSPRSSFASGSIVDISEGAIAMELLDAKVRKRRARVRKVAFTSAMVNCLCAGSILLFSLYAPVFQNKLGYSQMQINAVSIAGELGMYLPVPIFGSICDRLGPSKLSIMSSMFFGPAYLLAAYAINNDSPFHVMLIAWVFVGAGSSSMYFAGVTTCAKNFTGNSRGIALALPIAAFGLSSLWESQLVSRVFTDKAGDLIIANVFTFFAGLLTIVGFLGGVGLTIVPTEEEEEETIVRDVESVSGERTGLLSGGSKPITYGAESVGPITRKKEGFLSEATMSFLKDKTMWWFAAGVFLVTGSGESFINNMGTLIQSLYTPNTSSIPGETPMPKNPVSTAAHVSIVALTSTIARLLAGSLSDYLAPSVPVDPPAAEPEPVPIKHEKPRLAMSRMYLLIGFAVLMCFGQIFVATGMVDERGEWFWVVSSSIGAGYGAVFTLAPTIVSVVWGVENFGTNWGIVTITPAIGATLYGLIFAANYDSAAKRQHHGLHPQSNTFGNYIATSTTTGWIGTIASSFSSLSETQASLCYGKECYSTAFWIMGWSVALACGLWVYAWKGPGGWRRKGVVV